MSSSVAHGWSSVWPGSLSAVFIRASAAEETRAGSSLLPVVVATLLAYRVEVMENCPKKMSSNLGTW